jgi:hypothetical protein
VSVLKIILSLRFLEIRERVNKDSAAGNKLVCWSDCSECIGLYKY